MTNHVQVKIERNGYRVVWPAGFFSVLGNLSVVNADFCSGKAKIVWERVNSAKTFHVTAEHGASLNLISTVEYPGIVLSPKTVGIEKFAVGYW